LATRLSVSLSFPDFGCLLIPRSEVGFLLLDSGATLPLGEVPETMETKLKALKVIDLKEILSNASVAVARS